MTWFAWIDLELSHTRTTVLLRAEDDREISLAEDPEVEWWNPNLFSWRKVEVNEEDREALFQLAVARYWRDHDELHDRRIYGD